MRKCAKRTLCDVFATPSPSLMVGCSSVVDALAGTVVVAVMDKLSAVVGCQSFGKEHKKGDRLD